MDKRIHQEFLEGIYEVYSVVFTDGKNDGIELYRLSDSNYSGFYKELKVKKYKKPVLLVAKAVSAIQPSEVEVQNDVLDVPTFIVPYKSLLDNNVSCQTEDDWNYLNRSFIKFHEAYYEVKSTKPGVFIEDSFMTITFVCEYRRDIKELLIEEEGEE